MINTSEKNLNLSFKIMTCNLRFGLANDGENSWENRKKAYPELFENTRSDFIGFQEANTFQGDYIENLLKNHRYIGKREDSPEFWQNNLIFYDKSWKCLKKARYYLSETPCIESKLPESKWPRQCVIGLFEKEGRRLIHANTHFDFLPDVQVKSAEILMKLLSDFNEDFPVVITGDFNAVPDSSLYQFFISRGFKEVLYGAYQSTYHGFTGKDTGRHIDWILYSGGLKVIGNNIVKNSFSGIFPSDHYPVTASFEFI